MYFGLFSHLYEVWAKKLQKLFLLRMNKVLRCCWCSMKPGLFTHESHCSHRLHAQYSAEWCSCTTGTVFKVSFCIACSLIYILNAWNNGNTKCWLNFNLFWCLVHISCFVWLRLYVAFCSGSTCIVGECASVAVKDEPAFLPRFDFAPHFDQVATAGLFRDGQVEARVGAVACRLNMSSQVEIVLSHRQVPCQRPGLERKMG